MLELHRIWLLAYVVAWTWQVRDLIPKPAELRAKAFPLPAHSRKSTWSTQATERDAYRKREKER